MVSERGDLDVFHLPRMAQLINKSNQFHLTGTRYSEAELKTRAGRSNESVRYFKLSDKFGDNGLISVVIAAGETGGDLVIDTWVMSCRVLGRTMEEFIFNDIVETARRMGCKSILGRYVASAKNKLVSQLYARLGFSLVSETDGTTTWRLAVTPDRAYRKTSIAPKP
jgi:FkbH-like protein